MLYWAPLQNICFKKTCDTTWKNLNSFFKKKFWLKLRWILLHEKAADKQWKNCPKGTWRSNNAEKRNYPQSIHFSLSPLKFSEKGPWGPPPPLLIPTKSNSSNFDFVLPHTQKGEEEDDQLARLEDAHCVTTNSLFLGGGKEFATFSKNIKNIYAWQHSLIVNSQL